MMEKPPNSLSGVGSRVFGVKEETPLVFFTLVFALHRRIWYYSTVHGDGLLWSTFTKTLEDWENR